MDDRRLNLAIVMMVLDLAVAFALALTPVLAYADETEKESEPTQNVTLLDSETLDKIKANSEDTTAAVSETNKTLGETNKTLGEISGKLDVVEDVKESVDNVGDRLKGIDSKVDSLILEQSEPEPEPVKKLGATKGKITFSAYNNANPSSQFALYAKQIVPKMGWEDDYAFVQDSSSSYVLVYGDLDLYTAGTVIGTQCHYIRWYYSGTGTGYLVQSGVADVDVSMNGYVVLSSLGDYPLLDDGFTLFRQEVSFYALVAVVLFCLTNIWGYTLRSRG